MKETGNEEGVSGSSFDRARGSMAEVLEAYQKNKQSGENMSNVDLYKFPPMMRLVREAERENLEGALKGEAFRRIEETPQFVALSKSAAGAKAIKRSHLYIVRLSVLDELEREGNDVTALRRIVEKDIKDNPDPKE